MVFIICAYAVLLALDILVPRLGFPMASKYARLPRFLLWYSGLWFSISTLWLFSVVFVGKALDFSFDVDWFFGMGPEGLDIFGLAHGLFLLANSVYLEWFTSPREPKGTL